MLGLAYLKKNALLEIRTSDGTGRSGAIPPGFQGGKCRMDA
jgi:hypothetical protein